MFNSPSASSPQNEFAGLPANSLLPLWRRINQEFLARIQRGNTVPAVSLTLMYLHYNSAENEPAKLADAMGIPRQSMTSTLDYLEKNGLANRQPHPHDRRRKQVKLTPAGQQRAQELFTDLLWLESYALKAVDGPELKILQNFLTQYAEALAEGNELQSHSSESKES